MAKEMGEFKVTEKAFKIQEVILAAEQGRLHEMFGSGTAALVSPVSSFNYKDVEYEVPIEEEKGAGQLTQRMLRELNDLQVGVVSRPEWQFKI